MRAKFSEKLEDTLNKKSDVTFKVDDGLHQLGRRHGMLK